MDLIHSPGRVERLRYKTAWMSLLFELPGAGEVVELACHLLRVELQMPVFLYREPEM